MSVYSYDNYKAYFNEWVESQPKGGHGEYRRVALALGISTTMVSQVFKSDKHLSLEMACELGDYLNLTEDELDFFLLLVEHQKAGSQKLQKRFHKQIKGRQEKARKLENRIKRDLEMDDATKSIFYSSWMYAAIRILTDTPEGINVVEISRRLNLPRNQVQKVVDFLLLHRLCEIKDDRLRIGAARTYIGSSNLLVVKHHQNWRLQGFNKMIQSDDDNFFYTSPMSLSREVAEKIRIELPNIIEKISKMVGPSESEVVRCLNVDWFEY